MNNNSNTGDTDDLNYETKKTETPQTDAAGKQDSNGAAPSKKDDSTTHSSKEPMAEDIPKDGSMPRY